jgi:hypothetical protein
MKRNSLLGGLSLVVAGAAIGSGALVSANAMADDGTSPPEAASTHVISMATDGGQPISCTFDDLPLPSELDALPAGEEASGAVVAVSGVITTPSGAGDGMPAPGEAITIGGEAVVGQGTITDLNGEPIDLTTLTPGEGFPDLPALQVVSADDARQGTADECAAIRANLP